MHDRDIVAAVLSLDGLGLSTYEIARRTGVPRTTVHRWLREGPPTLTASKPPAMDRLPSALYAFLLGMYLGDGCISRIKRSWRLEIFQDRAYPGSTLEIAGAIASISGVNATVRQARRSEMSIVGAYWAHWPTVFPQHGPGRKHERSIVLTDWQLDHTRAHPEALVRGLMHSDGCRYIARQKCYGKVYAYERYSFKNESADIRTILTDHLRLLGVHWTYSHDTQVDVNRRADVARLDEFVGPKY